MNEKTHILFDLDGTITDSFEGICKSAQYALQYFGITVPDFDTLRPFIGPPLRDSFRNLFGFNDEQVEQAVTRYREYFSVTGLLENTLYTGMDVLLPRLKAEGKLLCVATSKATVYAQKILQHFNIAQHFHFIAGSELDGQRSKKAEVIRYALEHMPVINLKNAVMIGDRKHDVLGAKEIGMDCIGVLYGYGDEAELTAAGVTVMVDSVEDLGRLLL